MAGEAKLRRDAQAIFRAALLAADPQEGIRRLLKIQNGVLHAGPHRFPLHRYRRIIVVGAGKASANMAHAIEKILGKRIHTGHINTKDGHLAPVRRIQLHECSHPVPDERGVQGSRRIADLALEATADDLFICLISGGASALMPLPAGDITLAEKQETTRLLLACGATIHEMNAVRKHISGIKGGELARLAAPATVLSLLLSDVVGDPLDVIGSGPTAPDDSTFLTAWRVIRKYNLEDRIPFSVRQRLEAGLHEEIPDTPKPGDPVFQNVTHLLVGSNRLAVDAAAAKAKELGYKPLVLSTTIEGETRDVAQMHAAIARECLESGRPAKPPLCLISGGETTVTLHGDGLGGRNLEFVLAAALALEGARGVAVLSAGTDGTDGPTDAAGAVADGLTTQQARDQGLDPVRALAENNSYRFFEAAGGLLKTGPTGTNVMDVRLILLAPQSR